MPPAVILCYHSLTSADYPSASPTHVPLDELVAAIGVVRSFAEIVPLRDLVARHRAGRSTRGLAALTFDDGYAALPPLLGGRVPITVFVTTDATDRGARFWWDRIDDLFPRVSPTRWRAFEDAIGLPAAFRDGQPPELGPLRPIRQWVMATYQGRWPAHLESPLAEIEQEFHSVTAQRAMTWDEIAAFAAHDLVDFGVHTRSHPVLPLLDDSSAVAEIADAFSAIRARVSRAVPILAAPFGLYDAQTIALARRAGMEATLSLGNRPMRGVHADDALPRLSMARGLARWKLALRLTLPRRVAPGYPDLPSATT